MYEAVKNIIRLAQKEKEKMIIKKKKERTSNNKKKNCQKSQQNTSKTFFPKMHKKLETVDLVTFTEEIRNGILHFLRGGTNTAAVQNALLTPLSLTSFTSLGIRNGVGQINVELIIN